jgi:hypothetical protein
MSLGPDPSVDPEGATAPVDAPDTALDEGSDHDEGLGSGPQTTPASTEPAATTAAPTKSGRFESPNMLPGREARRSVLERLLVRLIATCGIVGIGVAIAAIMVHSKSQGWVVGLVVSIVSVALSALLWSSRQL